MSAEGINTCQQNCNEGANDAQFNDSPAVNTGPKTILVTGGAGFIGSHVSQWLLERGDRVIIVDEMNDYYDVRLKQANLEFLRRQYQEPQLVIHRGDICDVDFMSEIFETERPTHICHLAARAGVRASIVDPYIYVHSNIEGTTRLLDLARQYVCQNFVFASSSSVYGCSTEELLSEADAVEKPVSPYAATKKACELLAYTFHHLYGLNCTGLRFFTVYGPRGRPDMAPFKFIDRVFNEIPIQRYGDGSTSRDYTFIDDIVDGVIRAIDRPLGYEIINLGNGRPYLLKDFISLVEFCVGKKAIIEILPEQPGDVERTCADISKARRLLGYDPKVPFEEGIARTAAWYKQAANQGLFDDALIEEETASGGLQHEQDSANINNMNINNTNNNSSNSNFINESVQTNNEVDIGFAQFNGREYIDAERRGGMISRGLGFDLSGLSLLSQSQDDHSSVDQRSSSVQRSHSASRALRRYESDLELSSYVEKASTQVRERSKRIINAKD